MQISETRFGYKCNSIFDLGLVVLSVAKGLNLELWFDATCFLQGRKMTKSLSLREFAKRKRVNSWQSINLSIAFTCRFFFVLCTRNTFLLRKITSLYAPRFVL